MKALMLRMINNWVCRAHCHKVVKLSDAVQDLPRQCTQFVHGVSPQFLAVGAAKARAAREAAEAALTSASPENALASLSGAIGARGDAAEAGAPPVWSQGAYFLGKVVWAKGYTELLDLMEKHKARGGEPVAMDIFGSGGDKQVRFRNFQLLVLVILRYLILVIRTSHCVGHLQIYRPVCTRCSCQVRDSTWVPAAFAQTDSSCVC